MSEKDIKTVKETKTVTTNKESTAKPKKIVKKKTAVKSENGKKTKKKPNWILWTGLAVILIPCMILLYIIIGTKENAGVPVTSDRFENELDPAITSDDLTWLKDNLTFDYVESVNVNLISATLRITINTNDDLDEDQISTIADSAYDKVMEKLPAETYFTNRVDGDKTIKMYDIEVHVYNLIPEEGSEVEQIYMIRSKTGASEGPRTDVVSSPKEEDVADQLMNPDKQEPQEEAATGEN